MAEKSKCKEDEGDSCVFSQSLMKLNLGPPKKKLVVLSIGGLLCHRVYCNERSRALILRSPDAIFGSYEVYKRPYCTDFLKFCLARFEVGIWSSATERNMNDALNCIMIGLGSKLLFAWDQSECTNSGFNTLENKHKPIFLKELAVIWENMKQYSPSNTLLIDTDPRKALLNPPNTAVFPNEYRASNVNDCELGPQGELRLFLDGLANADDVISYVKEHPFGQPAITPKHPDWYYYSEIVRNNSKN